jgi:hypothetical protein
MIDMIFPIIILLITAGSTLAFYKHLADSIYLDEVSTKIIDNQKHMLNWKYTISTKDNENE